VYRKGGKVKKYAEGGALRDEKGDYKRDPATGTREYASFSDLMGDLFGKGKKAPESKAAAMDEVNTKAQREVDKAREKSDSPTGGVDPLQGVDTAPARAPRRSSGSTAQRRSMERRSADQAETETPGFRPSRGRAPGSGVGGMSEMDIMEASRATQAPYTRNPRRPEPEVMRNLRRAVHGADYARERESNYAKGGGVKMASGGTCRGMGAATKGGKYTIK
jgi:hypothetical protein